jgi:hypothetical protein
MRRARLLAGHHEEKERDGSDRFRPSREREGAPPVHALASTATKNECCVELWPKFLQSPARAEACEEGRK